MSEHDAEHPATGDEPGAAAKGQHAEGTGGLTLEAPDPNDITGAPIGFAPDLENGPGDSLWEAPEPSPHSARTARPAVSRRPLAPGADYPLARRVLQQLLTVLSPTTESGLAPNAPPPLAPVRPDATAETPAPSPLGPTNVAPGLDAFAVGQSIMKAPPPIITPPPAKPETSAAAQTAQGQLEDMVDVVLVGAPDSGDHEIHLMFKEDVLRGLYLRLERRDDGLFAHFTVADDTTRRAIEGEVHTLLGRLEARGMKLAGHTIALKT